MAFNKDKALKEADKLVAKGKDREAVVQYKEVVKNDPRDLNTLNKLGDLHLKLGNKAEALDCYAQIADRYAQDGFNLRAIAMYKKCTRTDPARVDFHVRLADLNAQQGLVNEARAEYQLVAEQYLKEGKSQAARDVYAKIAEIEPDNLKTRLRLADLYLKDNQLNLALGEYQVIGTELAKKGMLDESLQVLQKALGLDPSNLQILRAMARTHAGMGRADDGIRFIHQRLQEKGGSDPDLLLVLGEAYQAAGNLDHAAKVLERAAQVAPARADIQAALFKLALDAGDADLALQRYAPVSERLLAEGKGAQVVEDLKGVLRAKDGHVPTIERLLAVLIQVGADGKLQSDWMSRLSEAYIARGQYQQAEGVLDKLVVMESDVAQHHEKLEFVRLKLKGAAARAPAATPEASFGGLEEPAESASFSMSFDEGELEAEVAGTDERAELISERMAEADVFIKYGLVDKAVEQLQSILAQFPDDLPTRQRLKGLLVDDGKRNDAIEQCLAIAAILRQAGDAAGEAEALAEAREVNPNHPAVAAAMGAAGGAAAAAGGRLALGMEPPEVEVTAEPEAGGFDLASAEPQALDGGGFEISLDEGAAAGPPEPPQAAASGDFAIALDAEPTPAARDFEISLDGEPPAAQEAAATSAAEDGSFEISLDEPSVPAEPSFELSVEPPAPTPEDVGFEIDAGDGGAAEAPAPTAAAQPAAFELAADSEPATEAAFELAPAEEPSTSAPDLLFSGGGSMLEEEDVTLRAEEPAVVGATQAAAAAAAPMTSGAPALGEPAGDEGLFGEEADFFDFADELNKELGVGEEGVTEVSRGGDHQMTLEQIVSGIQSGVAKQVDPADYETHYNLGIAYKEMGLQDEAIGEFQYASKDPAKFLQCCILLGACFTEKGMPELAIKWYEKGRATPTATEDDHLALGYEIAACREALGEDAEALKGYMEIFATNARYRDVGAHVASLKQKLGR